MRFMKFAALAVIVLCFTANLFAQEVSEYKRYPYKSGIIEYEITGNTYQGTAVLYWDNYGMKEALYTDKKWKKSFITLHSVNEVEIVDGDYNYTIDLDDEEGTKKKNDYAEKFGNLEDANAIYKQTMDVLKELGFQTDAGIPGTESSSKKNTKRFCGKDCDIFKLNNGELKLTYYIWMGIILASDEILPKIPMVGQPQFTKKCTSVKIDVPVPAEKFEIPKGTEIEEDK